MDQARYKVDIAPLSETRFSEQGQLKEASASYTFVWSGRSKEERRDAGFTCAIRNDIVGQGHVDAPSVAALAAAGLCSRPEARSTGCAGDQGDPRCRCLDGSPPRHLQDEAPTLTPKKAPRRTTPMFSSDGTAPLTEKSPILKRWAEHFRNVLNCSSAIFDATIDGLHQVDTNNDLYRPPSLTETVQAVQQISIGRAPPSEAIPPEVTKHSGPLMMEELTTLFLEMWLQGQVPQEFKDATIVYLYNRKENRQLCDNHRGISLLNIAIYIYISK
ncbi:unnamed protein product [Schistocephalus solidus]|uniref:Uncharacterized protein n=1 Tax=Schistocephalus solidus TaxID=70667 RepID=A0A3P7CC65_SCHSO|nr:unnamed protein product [Schistocephalus solidus]